MEKNAGATLPLVFDTNPWVEVKDGDPVAREIFGRHYSRHVYGDGRRPKLFVGPGGKMVLLTKGLDALFVWRKFRDDCIPAQGGVNCAVFRNEGVELSSRLILAAEELAWRRWPGERFYTYVNADKVKHKRDPGRCFIKAGWSRCGATKTHKLLIFEKFPEKGFGKVE